MNNSSSFSDFNQQEDVQILQVNFDQQQEQSNHQNTNFEQGIDNLKLKQQNQKLFETIHQLEIQIQSQNNQLKNFQQERQQQQKENEGLKNIVEQQRDFINQVNEDQAYADLTNQLEISIEKLKDYSEQNFKLQNDNTQLISLLQQQQTEIGVLTQKIIELQQNLHDLTKKNYELENKKDLRIIQLENRIKSILIKMSEQDKSPE